MHPLQPETLHPEIRRFLAAALQQASCEPNGHPLDLPAVARRAQIDVQNARKMLQDLRQRGITFPAQGPDEFHIHLDLARDLIEMSTNSSGPKYFLPPAYEHLEKAIAALHEVHGPKRSVFVMMKFPDSRLPQSAQDCLTDLFGAIRDELQRYGLTALRADQRHFHPQLWDNLCAYMFACHYGLAVLEDVTGSELNPNVALEYGFMRALGKSVLLLQEEKFTHIRADIAGTLPRYFQMRESILDIGSVRSAIQNWMVDLQLPAIAARV